MELRPYQIEAKAAVLREWEEKDKTLLVLPTGCGKTIVFASIAKDRTNKGKVLILAHREELLDQASDKIMKSCGMGTAMEKADKSCIGSDEAIVVGSVQTLKDKRLSRFSHDYFKTIIVDEAHHCLAKSYKNILDYFDSAKILGVTATPDRGDMKNLGEIFQSIAYEYNLRDAVKQGYLSPIRVQTMPLKIDMSRVAMSQGDYALADSGNALEPYLEDIAEEMRKVCMHKHTVVFLPLVNISQKFRDILNGKGFRAAEVNGESKNRDEVLRRFAEGEYNVLCNSMLLTEGWDCPIVDCIVVLRPTKVRGLYCQMIGRGTRPAPGKDHLLILDFLWMTGKHKLVHPADIICKSEDNAIEVTKKLEKGTEADLFAIEHDVEEERRKSLEKAIKDAEKKRKDKKLIDPLDYEYDLDDDSLTDYVPVFGWESEPATEKQLGYLRSMQLNVDVDSAITKGKAKVIIDTITERVKNGLATPRQMQLLRKRSYSNVNKITKEEATKIIGMLAAVNWKTWNLPTNFQPAHYVPESIRED